MDSGSSPGHWRHSPAPPWEGRGRCSARPQSAGEAHGFPTRSADRDLSGPPWGPGEGTRGRPGPLPGRRVWLRPRSRVWRFRSLTGSPAGSVGRGPEFEPPAGTRGQSYGRPAARRPRRTPGAGALRALRFRVLGRCRLHRGGAGGGVADRVSPREEALDKHRNARLSRRPGPGPLAAGRG